MCCFSLFFFFSSRRRHTRCSRDWSSDVCSSDLHTLTNATGTRPLVPRLRDDTSSSVWLPQVTLAYRVCRPILVYAAAARGYRPGGLSHLTDDFASARFAPQVGWTWETGVHGAWLDERVRANLALYWIRVRGYQDVQRVGLTSFTVLNARQVTSRGVEFELTANPRSEEHT